jgi:hypothetical protein
MSLRRFAKRADSTQAAIVKALRAVGIKVWIISKPCDLLTYYVPYKRWRPLECKPEKRKRNDQPEQDEFLAEHGVLRVRTPSEAIEAITRS